MLIFCQICTQNSAITIPSFISIILGVDPEKIGCRHMRIEYGILRTAHSICTHKIYPEFKHASQEVFRFCCVKNIPPPESFCDSICTDKSVQADKIFAGLNIIICFSFYYFYSFSVIL